MKNFKEIAEKCLAGELSGTFVFQNGQKILSSKLQKYDKDAPYGDYPYYISHICTLTNYGFGYNSDYNVIDFIPNNMQTKIEIDIPEGKVPVMERTESGVVITWKEKELTYDDIVEILQKDVHNNYIENLLSVGGFVATIGSDSSDTNIFYKKVEVLRKLTNIRNYFGKPDSYNKGYLVEYSRHDDILKVMPIHTVEDWVYEVIFKEKEHTEQAIKMLGDELKYLFKPW